MTEKQIARVREKIKKIRAALAAEKRMYGGYDDSRGLRYAPPELYLKIGDYSGALTYFRWFHKNFPDDVCYPEFLFIWTIILFKTGKIKDAEKKAIKTYFGNTYVFDKFFGNPIVPIDKYEYSNLDQPSYTEYFHLSSTQPELAGFSEWLAVFIRSERFQQLSSKFIALNIQLKTVQEYEKRRQLLTEIRMLENGG
ncbi:MAG: hypothetical protein R3D00_08565 [Bacteroidia bacterium]